MPDLEPAATQAISPRVRRVEKIIACIEAAGGMYFVVGIVFMALPALRAGYVAAIRPLVLCVVVGAIASVAGVELFRNARRGREISLILQVAQVPVVVLPAVHYSCFSVLRIMVKAVNGQLTFSGDFGGELYSRFGGAGAPLPSTVVGVNVLALAFAVVLWRAVRRGRGAAQPVR